MKYLILSFFFYPEVNGISQSVFYRCKELASRGNTVSLLVPGYPTLSDQSAVVILKSLGVRIIGMPLAVHCNPMTSPFPDHRCTRTLADEIASFQPDVLLVDEPMPLYMDAGFCLSDIICIVPEQCLTIALCHVDLASLCTNYGMSKDAAAINSKVDTIYGQYDAVFVPSVFLKNNYLLNINSTVVSFLGVDTEMFKPSLCHEVTDVMKVIYVGRLSREKNLHLFIDAAENLREQGLNIEWTFVGSGPMLETLETLSTSGNIRFMGERPSEIVAMELKRNDLFITGCDFEAFGITVSEAMACGLPVMTSYRGGNAEQYEHFSSGINFDIADMDSLLNGMKYFYYHKAERIKMGEIARRSVTSWSMAVDNMEIAISSLKN
ncbi:glycosyl transferase [Aeromonas salmonicida subsp. salmonicida]|uniref:Glycosyltransferase, family 4 n=3 Tax=Gammaproteobacteria TaxID=1236 RepID=A4SPM9_AERS4|nr:glycosyltransferase family 4 protein [Aeromonas salmonicida]ABO90851.1 glycosyltransferase, family 4 [Aeromonas salmonicida subsp. salmonicida A449]AYO63900.1 glycosyltransferase family 1 protein [Aeromonas salmonicida subsp. salmonicida 01-B526]EKP0238147.1 glycosyltransferase family 4 protein [Aeromonas salmonicida]EKP0242328.1 glycosyltransferase family 4 protein [Aeromonas salmonicida]EKP0250815.1 glycosyltransferase family 4 protein [Aeromonas salmonicida]